ncbi:hypothetical protein [Proteus alimentorum]|uniref:hypothetical protein n=1 Tax=Proteus alimentorum TaxID=1973495 RepID=UPI000BFF8CFB|nr:hypothetical protein [Proteus alimentorum]
MIGPYQVLDYENNLIFSFENLVECYDYKNTNRTKSFVFMGINESNLHFEKDKSYYLVCQKYDNRLSFSFNLNKYYFYENNLIVDSYFDSGMYLSGTISLLDFYEDSKERIWLEMRGELKEIYISASYIKNGFPKKILKNELVIEGKYIQDYYSFYCELGYALLGPYGYMGRNLDAVRDLFIDIAEIPERKITWIDSELSFMAIDNTIPPGYYPSVSEDIVSILEDYFIVELK